jgi:hypothetical protein
VFSAFQNERASFGRFRTGRREAIYSEKQSRQFGSVWRACAAANENTDSIVVQNNAVISTDVCS